MFERCFAASEFKQAAGIALETRRLDVLERAIMTAPSPVDMLDYVFGITMSMIANRTFRDSVLVLLARLYLGLPQPNYFQMFQCFIYLGNGADTSNILMKLIKDGQEALAYQLAFDLYDSATQLFLVEVCDGLAKLAGPVTTSADNAAPVDGEAAPANPSTNQLEPAVRAILDKVDTILRGTHTLALSVEFLSRNNHADKLLLGQIKEAAGRNSICHNATVMTNAVMYAGTTSDVFLTENVDWLKMANNWARFNAAASLGVIHQGHTAEAMSVLEPYLPKDGGGDGGPYVNGGGLYALGLIYANHGAQVTNYFLQRLREPGLDEIVQHGGCLGLGLASMGSAREDVYNQMRDNHLICESAVAGEAAGIGMGLVMLGSANESALAEMTNYAKETQHEKIIRGLALGVALVMYGRQEQADGHIAELVESKDHILRMAAVHMIATAYVGTGENRIVKQLLHIAVSDVSDDVRRCAVTSLGFVLCRIPEQLPSTVNLLSESFNPHVRYGTCLALGIAFAATGNAQALSLLEPLYKDSVAFVRQGSMIALGMIMMQQTAEHPKFEMAKGLFKKVISGKHEDPLAKFGAIYAQGIMNAGGQNVTTQLVNAQGHVRMQSVVGTLVFTQHWFWHPLGHFLSIAMRPSAVICLNKDLKMPRIELKSNARAKKFAYPPATEPPKEKSKDKVETAVLSITSKVKAANAETKDSDTAKDENAMEDVDADDSAAPKSDEAEKSDAKEDAEMTDNGEDKVEAEYTMLSNPARVVLPQLDVVELPIDGRYHSIAPGTLHMVTVLEDGSPDEPEELIEIKLPASSSGAADAAEEDAECPEPFTFDVSLEDE